MNAPDTSSVSQLLADALAKASLEDKYTVTKGRAYLTGSQALVRLLMLQKARDDAQGLNTAGFVSGYRGSPLGAVDQALWAAKAHLNSHRIVFQPGLNEDLAATSVWGSQQVNLYPDALVQGVFGMWYGKGPGVDRCGDVFKHANAAGTSPHGGVLVVAGDDHAAKSSTLPHQSDHILKACLIPVLYPSTVQEYLDLGLHGYAMSRYAGVWVGFKCVADVVESSASVEIDPDRVQIRLPQDFPMPQGGLNIRWPDAPLEQEARILDHKLYAALAYARLNRLNHTTIESPHARFGIIASGKAYQDTLQALNDLGLTPHACHDIGIRVFKVTLVWPLEAHGVNEFAQGLEEILVIEEKRQVIEYQVKEELYNAPAHRRPRVYGKFDEHPAQQGGEWSIPQSPWLLPAHHELNPALIAKAIAARLKSFHLRSDSPFQLPESVMRSMDTRLQEIEHADRMAHPSHVAVERTPYFCSGCPHNTSTQVPEGSRAMAGIGCHYMAVWMNRHTETFTQMGGEGVPWIGQAPFTSTPHVFANLGDGTYFHSGILAIRASVSAGVNITYKILYNDAVAMTGGQKIDGTLSVSDLVAQVQAEGVRQVVLVSDEPEKYSTSEAGLPSNVQIWHRTALDEVQKTLRQVQGTTVLLYVQTCASEKRRRRKRIDAHGQPQFPDPPRRAYINTAVCEGCGDCGQASNCLSIEPVATPLGTKRRVNQSTCNKDYSCVQGECPSFVTVEGGRLKSPPTQRGGVSVPDIPPPAMLRSLSAQNPRAALLITGVGGTGVVTIGAWLGMAAHLEGKAVNVLDMAGLAQKGGAVYSHVQIATDATRLYAPRIAAGEADVLLGGDLIVSASAACLSALRPTACAVVNLDTPPTAAFLGNPDWTCDAPRLEHDIQTALASGGACHSVSAQGWMLKALGDTLYSNAFLLGYAWQLGVIPLARDSLRKAIELNRAQVQNNLTAFECGRWCAHDRQAFIRACVPHAPVQWVKPVGLDDALAQCRRHLLEAQGEKCVSLFDGKYRTLRLAVEKGMPSKKDQDAYLLAWSRVAVRVLAPKDEYEVARLLSSPAFAQELAQHFEGDYTVNFHVAPQWLRRGDRSARPRKTQLGPWALHLFRLLSRFRFLRGSALDPFAYGEEFKLNQRVRAAFEQCEAAHQRQLESGQSVNVAALMQEWEAFLTIRGYGNVRKRNADRFFERWSPRAVQ